MSRTGYLLLGMGIQAIVTGVLALTHVLVIGPVVLTVEGALLLYLCLALVLAGRVPTVGPRGTHS